MFTEYQWKQAVFNAYCGTGKAVRDAAIWWTGEQLVVSSRYDTYGWTLLHIANKTYSAAPNYKTALKMAGVK